MSELIFTPEEFEGVKTRAEELYMAIGEVECPFLKGPVSFNVKGLDHIKMKRWNHARPQNDQFMRLKLLYLASEVIKHSSTIQGLDDGNKMQRIKVNSRWETKMVRTRYYEFIAVLKGCRVRVVVKQIDDGTPYFWSIIPYWKQGEFKRKMVEGDPETD